MKNEVDFRQFYDLERYLFETVRPRFIEKGKLSAFDFFCIIIWKSNRSKSKIAKRLLKQGYETLDAVVLDLTRGLAQQSTPKDKLHYLWKAWGFRLPIASAILTVLYPGEFTVYDKRVCNVLGTFHDLAGCTKFEDLWAGYEDFRLAVEESAPQELSLRDKDRYLWGKSFHSQLEKDIKQRFVKIYIPQPRERNLFDEYLQLPEDELVWEL